MKTFLGKCFLLSNQIAEELYFDYAANQPVIDYHNHLDPEAIANNHTFDNITQAWLYGDHYKWRAMRANGISENYITGNAPDKDKFMQWAATVPYTLRNPLYHWTHLELQRYFGISELLDQNSAKRIYEETHRKLKLATHNCQAMIRQMNVQTLCTTDDSIDDLIYHQKIAASDFKTKVLPTFRPDKALAIDDPKSYQKYIEKLENVSGIQVNSLESFLSAMQNRVDFFHAVGCRISDLGLGRLPMINRKAKGLDIKFKTVISGQNISIEESEELQAYILSELCKMYHTKGWVQQFHLGALRNNSSRAFRDIGPDTGYDSMGDFSQGVTLSAFFNYLDDSDQLAKSIIYNLNPRDNELFATMTGNFNDGKTIGKIQFGTGWWFLDQKNGIENQINALSNMGLLSRFIGMLTDSRSFLSFPRHEYFRRILCNLIAVDVTNGELPHDMELLGSMIEGICYKNAKTYFNF